MGKVAGIESIRVLRREAGEPKPSFWVQTYSGSAGVQIVRILTYLLGFVILLIVIGTLAIVPSEAADRRRRDQTKDVTEQYLKPLLQSKGPKGQRLIREVFQTFRGNIDSIEAFLNALLSGQRIQNGSVSPSTVWTLIRDHRNLLAMRLSTSELLFDQTGKDNHIELNPRAVSTLQGLITFLGENPLPGRLADLAKKQTTLEVSHMQSDARALIDRMETVEKEAEHED